MEMYVHDTLVQLRGNQKDFNSQIHHRLSKFKVPVVVNLKHFFLIFWALYHLLIDPETIGVNSIII